MKSLPEFDGEKLCVNGPDLPPFPSTPAPCPAPSPCRKLFLIDWEGLSQYGPPGWVWGRTTESRRWGQAISRQPVQEEGHWETWAMQVSWNPPKYMSRKMNWHLQYAASRSMHTRFQLFPSRKTFLTPVASYNLGVGWVEWRREKGREQDKSQALPATSHTGEGEKLKSDGHLPFCDFLTRFFDYINVTRKAITPAWGSIQGEKEQETKASLKGNHKVTV